MSRAMSISLCTFLGTGGGKSHLLTWSPHCNSRGGLAKGLHKFAIYAVWTLNACPAELWGFGAEGSATKTQKYCGQCYFTRRPDGEEVDAKHKW